MNTPQVEITNEQINDIPLLLGIMEDMGIRQHMDSQIAQHGNWEGISIGTLVEIWLCYILTARDHRLVAVREWAEARRQTFNALLGIELRETDLTDDRLARALSHLGLEGVEQAIDQRMVQAWVTVYALPTETVRLDTTSVSVYSAIEDEWGLIQRGHSKDHRPDLGQFKVMLSTLDPLGMPLSCAVVEGQRADDPLYVPMYDQTVQTLGRRDVLVVGDSKMQAAVPICVRIVRWARVRSWLTGSSKRWRTQRTGKRLRKPTQKPGKSRPWPSFMSGRVPKPGWMKSPRLPMPGRNGCWSCARSQCARG
jgi:transposase